VSSWRALDAELAAWEAAGLTPSLWWRDDDAQTVTPDLETLLELSHRHRVPAHLSVIPDGVQHDLAARLRDTDTVWTLQHGPDLARGWEMLKDVGMPHLLTGFVPPWNRIGDAIRRHLPDWGYDFLSSYEGRADAVPVAGLTHIDAHLDPIRWKYDRIFRGQDKMLAMLIEHLVERRTNNPHRPIGYVTHHLQTHAAIWEFSDSLFTRTHGMWTDVPQMQKDA